VLSAVEMKLLLASLCATCGALSAVETAFQMFQTKYNKHYATEQERSHRVQVFKENMEMVESRNQANIAAGGESVHGVTRFSDLTQDEFRSRYLMSLPAAQSEQGALAGPAPRANADPVIDWREKNAVLPIENEGQCGSTWAFSIKEAIESYAFILNKDPLIQLSAEQLVACDTKDQGCNGGNPDTAYQYVIQAGGLESEEDYPYKSGNGTTAKCKFDKKKVKVSIKGYKMIPKGEAHVKAVLPEGPPSVCLSAESWQTYTGGVLTTCPGSLDHCVQAVGYNDTNKPPFWILRNQWSTDWGEQGYIRVEQGKNLCLLGNMASYPTF